MLRRTTIHHLSEGTRKRLTLVACILGSTIVFIDSSVVTVALTSIENDLGGGLALQEWVVDAYLLTLGALILVGGSMGDLFGEKRVFVIGVVSFAATSVLCAAAWNGNALIVARGLQGVAGAILTPAALATITVTFDGEERGAAIGAWSAWTGISFLIGPLVGGWLISVASWRSIFLINVPIALGTIGLLGAAMTASAPRDRSRRVDVVGALLCIAGLGGPVFALIEEPQHGFSDTLILGTLLGGAALLALFLLWERRAPDPMLPLRLFNRRNFTFANLETFTVYAGLAIQGVFLALFLRQLAGYSPFRTGLATVPVSAVMFFLSPRMGRLSMRFGPRLFMGLGPIVAAAGMLWIRELSPSFDYWTELLPGLLLFAFGLSLLVAPLTATVLADAGRGDAGIASGVNNAVARVAGLLGIAIVGAAIAGPSDQLDLSGYRLAMAITAGLMVFGGVTGLVGIRKVSQAQVEAVTAPG